MCQNVNLRAAPEFSLIQNKTQNTLLLTELWQHGRVCNVAETPWLCLHLHEDPGRSGFNHNQDVTSTCNAKESDYSTIPASVTAVQVSVEGFGLVSSPQKITSNLTLAPFIVLLCNSSWRWNQNSATVFWFLLYKISQLSYFGMRVNVDMQTQNQGYVKNWDTGA